MKKYIVFISVLACSLFGQADHLLLSTIIITPDSAEMVIIKNPTASAINLNNYYLTDATSSSKKYYNLPSGENYWSGTAFDFLVKFPDVILQAGDSLFIGMNTSDVFFNYYGFESDYSLGDADTPLVGDMGVLVGISGVLDNTRETMILFNWNGVSSIVQDVDYFLWNEINYDFENPVAHQYAIDKSNIDGYLQDTESDQQSYRINHPENYAFVRTHMDESGEIALGGNGITGNDETSENMIESWKILYNPLFVFGCTDQASCNYNELATSDDGSCEYPQVYYDCNGDCNNDIDLDGICDEIEAFYNCDSCDSIEDVINGQYDNQLVTIQGMVVDYFDVTVYNGPHSITIEDQASNRVEVVVWPDSWDLPGSEFGDVIQSPYQRYILRVTGVVGEYDSEKQIDVTSENNFEIQDWINNVQIISLDVAPFPFVPAIGERIKYSYSSPANDRLVIRVFDISGRFVTTLFDGMPAFGSKIEYWDGRTHLGELVMPGTYLMHIESTGFSTGESQVAMAPIVVGARLK